MTCPRGPKKHACQLVSDALPPRGGGTSSLFAAPATETKTTCSMPRSSARSMNGFSVRRTRAMGGGRITKMDEHPEIARSHVCGSWKSKATTETPSARVPAARSGARTAARHDILRADRARMTSRPALPSATVTRTGPRDARSTFEASTDRDVTRGARPRQSVEPGVAPPETKREATQSARR